MIAMTSSYVVVHGSTAAQPFYLNLLFYLTFLVSAHLVNDKAMRRCNVHNVGSEPQCRTGTPHTHKAVLSSDVNLT